MNCIFHSTVRHSYGNRELVSFFMSKFDNLSEHKGSTGSSGIVIEKIEVQELYDLHTSLFKSSPAKTTRLPPVNFSVLISSCMSQSSVSMANYGQLQKENSRASSEENQPGMPSPGRQAMLGCLLAHT